MRNDCPCNGCVPPKRTVTCHSTCKEYKIWAMIQKLKQREEYKDRVVTMQIIEMRNSRTERQNKYLPEPLKHGRKTLNN